MQVGREETINVRCALPSKPSAGGVRGGGPATGRNYSLCEARDEREFRIPARKPTAVEAKNQLSGGEYVTLAIHFGPSNLAETMFQAPPARHFPAG